MDKYQPEMIGKTISRYRILDKIGSGGMGVVYKAEDIKLKRTVALKFLPPYFSNDQDAKKRLIHEAQAASALDHPNICTIHEIDETDDGQLYISMAFYEGETLKDLISRGPVDVDKAINITLQICDGLDKAHKNNIIHRDIKPANIFITNDGIVKILDFGLAKLKGQTQLTQIGTTLGTIDYMSPEQASRNEFDKRTDIWSLGVLFYEMLAGELPFKGEYDQAVIYSILNTEYEPLKTFRKDISPELELIIKKVLMKDPELRYREIMNLRDDLISIKENKKIGRTRKTIKKIPVFITSFSVIVIALIIVFLFQKETIPFSNRDWILIGDFENHTGDKVFDKSLYTAFSLSIDQSRYVNVVSRRRMMETLKRMEKPDSDFLDEGTIREMAIREGINIYLVPGISRAANRYIITCRIEQANNGEILKSEIINSDENNILENLDELGQKIREDLGESKPQIQKQGKPLKQVTTSSLEALKLYSLGIEEHWKSNFMRARYYYENALKIDSNFTSAKASLGNLLFEKFDRTLGKKFLKDALKSIDRVTDKEKYGILAFYAVNVEGNLDDAIKYTRIQADLYPDDATPHNNLGWYYQKKRLFADAVAEYKVALQIDPHLILTYGGIVWTYLEEMGETDSAFVWVEKMLTYDNKNAWAYFYLGSVYVAMDSLINAQQAYLKARELSPEFTLNIYRLVHVDRLLGRHQDAIELLNRILSIDSRDCSPYYDLGINYEKINNKQRSVEYFDMYKKYAERLLRENPKDAESYFNLGFINARLKNYQKSLDLGRKAFSMDTAQYLHMAELMSLNKNTSLALTYLEKAYNAGFRDYVWLKLDPDLESLQEEPGFKKILNQ